ncbi:FHA domain-containing protein [Sarocladium implicatum]|nr:FHA domain-containing protein [Sarocladium implicatum]
MLTQPISSPPPATSGPPTGSLRSSHSQPGVPSSSSPSAAPSRPSRLRALSYLRSVTHNHLSRDNSHANHSTRHNSPSSSSARPANSLTRSASYSPDSSTPALPAQNQQQNAADAVGNRLTLVDSAPTRIAASRTASVPAVPSINAAAVAAATAPEPSPTTDAIDHAASPRTATMTRQRATSASEPSTVPATNGSAPDTRPSIRFSAYFDPRSNRPSLTFPPITRTLPTGTESIRVGRYSERDGQAMANSSPHQPSAAPVGFKSKVVSRRHCEFWHENGKWFIKDVKSSSGTFLNHIRLSPPSQESKAYPVNDGDIVQLGIDFKGGEEMIFRCVKMRLELNRGWQNKLNTFNMAAHKRLRTMANSAAAAAGSNSQDCAICLNSIAPCQSLFVAPCSHTWHFKCVKSLLLSPNYPVFICPNCRAGADLEADVDEPTDWDPEPSGDDGAEIDSATEDFKTPADPDQTHLPESDTNDVTMAVNSSSETPVRPPLPHTASAPLPIRNASASNASRQSITDQNRPNRTPSPPGHGPEGPLTPSNDAGPWVFDGSAAGTRAADANAGEMVSLDAAADMTVNGVSSDGSSR